MSPFEFSKKHTSWSPSKLQMWEECPARAKYKNIDRLPDPGGPALERGAKLHEQCELYVRGFCKDLDPELVRAKALLDMLRDAFKQDLAEVEKELAFRADWTSCAWMAPDVYVRFKLDAVLYEPGKKKALVVDHKTGKLKVNGEYQPQIDLYCVALMSAVPELEEVNAQLFFIDSGATVDRKAGVLKRADLLAVRASWDEKAGKMLADDLHAPTPNPGCRWCPYSRAKSGPCKF